MTLNELIMHLIKLEAKHGRDVRVLINHEDVATPEYIDNLDGTLPYVSVTSV